jgi:hypothetical protein
VSQSNTDQGQRARDPHPGNQDLHPIGSSGIPQEIHTRRENPHRPGRIPTRGSRQWPLPTGRHQTRNPLCLDQRVHGGWQRAPTRDTIRDATRHEPHCLGGRPSPLNGVPSFSVLDGWWVEGHEEGVTGWCIGEGWKKDSDPVRGSTSLYDKLENQILPMFYGRPLEYARVMRSAMALNSAFFNAQR